MRLLFGIVLIFFGLVFCPRADAQRAARPHSTIQGKLVGSDLKPVQYTELELVRVGEETIPNDSRFIGVSDTYGKFHFVGVPPGKYTLSINFGDKPTFLSPFGTFFFPSSPRREDATVIEVDTSTRISGLVFKLATKLVKNPIVGRITWPDGKPVQGAVIACQDLEFDLTSDFGSTRSDKNGWFSVEAFVGRRYQLGIMLFDRDMPSAWDLGQIIGVAESPEFVLSKTQGVLVIQLVYTKDARRIFDKYVG